MTKDAEKKKRRKVLMPIIISFLSLALVVSGVTIAYLLKERQEQPKPPVYGEDGKPLDGDVEKNQGTISAPGYERLEIKADTAAQGFALVNPAQNSCYMKISLILEDGTVLWTSQPTAPGEATDEVVISPTLPEGRYDGATLRYACFRDKACTKELNSVVINLYLLSKTNN